VAVHAEQAGRADGVIEGIAAGVPYLAEPPDGDARRDAPAVVAWHLPDSPRTPPAFASAVPLAGLGAWRGLLRTADDRPAAARRRLPDAIVKPVGAAVAELRRLGDVVDWQVVPGMAHALADEPGTEPHRRRRMPSRSTVWRWTGSAHTCPVRAERAQPRQPCDAAQHPSGPRPLLELPFALLTNTQHPR
jgi:hypothetical protein